MPSLVDLLCGCSEPVVARGASTQQAMEEATPESDKLLRACDYKADPTDPIDMKLASCLANYAHAATSTLMLCRIRPAEYELDGRRVRLYWADGLYSGAGRDQLLVHEHVSLDDERATSDDDVPLAMYLMQLANISASLRGHTAGAPAIARIPLNKRLTFAPSPPTPVEVDPGLERLRSMRVACQEAHLREVAADFYERSGRGQPQLQNSVLRAQPMASRYTTGAVPARASSHGCLPAQQRGSTVQQKTGYVGSSPPRANSQGCLPVGTRMLPPHLHGAPLEGAVLTMPPTMSRTHSRSASSTRGQGGVAVPTAEFLAGGRQIGPVLQQEVMRPS
mmetsp:Transcript_93102/g.262924  ORF Transcript_93102/g.262924 Transcript_93102/m.262924 type:complete len:335 (+) Transcript_93102:195-1199(+)